MAIDPDFLATYEQQMLNAVEEKEARVTIFLLPESVPAVLWFMENQNAIWLVGFNGIESLNYSQIQAAFAVEQPSDAKQLFKQLKIIASAALDVIHHHKTQDTSKK